jgi:HSP20 family protein
MAKHADQFVHGTITYLSVPPTASHSAWTPNTDVYEKGDELMVRMEVAGIDKEDLEITLNDRLLMVRGQRRDPCRRGRCAFRQMEIDYGYFERRIVIPRSVDGSRVRARYQNGFLQIELPKAQTSDHRRVTVIIEQAE